MNTTDFIKLNELYHEYLDLTKQEEQIKQRKQLIKKEFGYEQ